MATANFSNIVYEIFYKFLALEIFESETFLSYRLYSLLPFLSIYSPIPPLLNLHLEIYDDQIGDEIKRFPIVILLEISAIPKRFAVIFPNTSNMLGEKEYLYYDCDHVGHIL